MGYAGLRGGRDTPKNLGRCSADDDEEEDELDESDWEPLCRLLFSSVFRFRDSAMVMRLFHVGGRVPGRPRIMSQCIMGRRSSPPLLDLSSLLLVEAME